MTRNNVICKSPPPVEEIKNLFEKANSVLVVSHIDPDGDALGTQLAFGEYLSDIGKKVFLLRHSNIPEKYSFLPGVDKIMTLKSLPGDFTVDLGLVLECPSLERSGSVATYLKDNLPLINIDHHRESGQFGKVNWINIEASSVGEMAYEYFSSVGYNLSKTAATNLYVAILTDTGRFRFDSTSQRTMQIAGDLISYGAHPREICDKVYFDMSAAAMRLTGKVLNTIEYFDDNSICIISLTKRMLAEAGADDSSIEGLSDYVMRTGSVKSGALIRESSDTVSRISMRSSNAINVSSIASKLGGGGHLNAAGCSIELPLVKAKDKILSLLREANAAKN